MPVEAPAQDAYSNRGAKIMAPIGLSMFAELRNRLRELYAAPTGETAAFLTRERDHWRKLIEPVAAKVPQ
jgi:hypothetical protein